MIATSTTRVAAMRERRTGLKRLDIYAHPDDAQAIKDFAARLARKRELAAARAATRGT